MSFADGIFRNPLPVNDPVPSHAPGSPERARLQAELARQSDVVLEIPCVVGGVRHFTGQVVEVRNPCDHNHLLARAHLATPALVEQAIAASQAAAGPWAGLPWEERAAVFLRAASLLAGPWRDRVNAATMLGQAKTCHQAEIDAACELVDFWRFNVHFYRELLSQQPPAEAAATWNRTELRPLEGFVFAVTPFNFTSIALNLPTAPALLGNVALWKPSNTQLLSAWVGMELLEAAGLPPGVINFLPGDGADVGEPALASPHFAGLHFTGSTATFQHLYQRIAAQLPRYRSFPRIVGETGGKDFILAHTSADVDALAVAALRGAFEFQGQKCSAASRMFVPRSLWPRLRDQLVGHMDALRMGDVRDFQTFIGAVIDERAWTKHRAFQALGGVGARTLRGGGGDRSTGWFIEPTLVEVEAPDHRLLAEEVFGPVLATFVYEDNAWDDVMRLIDQGSPYALTGAVFANDRHAVHSALGGLRQAAGNFYINDKPTGAVVGQQPFGGARRSGTNDKAGAAANLMRWASPRTIKENLCPPTDWRYPFLG
ncbi:MAG: L-glutamate gamma-semialdehyde dehydrogenase [Deltaproteobacteria bacterium]|nr:L-glutamate gamma-semialdehyde dehydrogenase [Deltaproteobacteria bacterium]